MLCAQVQLLVRGSVGQYIAKCILSQQDLHHGAEGAILQIYQINPVISPHLTFLWGSLRAGRSAPSYYYISFCVAGLARRLYILFRDRVASG